MNGFQFGMALPPVNPQQQQTSVLDFMNPLAATSNPYSTPVGVPYNQQTIANSQAMVPQPTIYEGLLNSQDQGFSMMQGLTNQNATVPTADPSMWKQFTDFAGSQAFGNTLNAARGLAGAWMGMKQLGMAQDQFDFTKSAWQTQYADQKASYQKEIQDREERRASARK